MRQLLVLFMALGVWGAALAAPVDCSRTYTLALH